jgi:hypothetical protein
MLRTGTGGQATTVRVPIWLQALLDELAGLDKRYRAVAIVPGLDAQAPSALGFDVRFTLQDAILVPAAVPKSARCRTCRSSSSGSSCRCRLPLVPSLDTRGWTASRCEHARTDSFRFVTTHLDSRVPAIRVAQAKELLRTAANTSLPVVMVGDFNIPAIPRSIRRSRRIRQ